MMDFVDYPFWTRVIDNLDMLLEPYFSLHLSVCRFEPELWKFKYTLNWLYAMRL